MTGVSLLVTVLTNALVIGISAETIWPCPPRIFTNISITPCNYDELEGTQLQASGMVQLPDDYFLKVVVRHDTPSLCVFHRSSTNTSFTLQLITSVKESSLCSPEQMPYCLPSSHVSYSGSDYFGISVWSQQSSSVQYLIVNTFSWITFHKNLTNASFNLQDLWFNALNCKESLTVLTIVTVVMVVLLLCCSVCGMCFTYFMRKQQDGPISSRRYKQYDDTEECMLLSAEHSAMVTEMDELDADKHLLQSSPDPSLPSSAESEQGHIISNMNSGQRGETKEIHVPVEIHEPVKIHDVTLEEGGRNSQGEGDTPLLRVDLDNLRLGAALDHPPSEVTPGSSSASVGSPVFNPLNSRKSSTSAISAKSKQDHQRQSEIVGSYATGQVCSGSPTSTNRTSIKRNDPSRKSSTSTISAKSEQGNQCQSQLVGPYNATRQLYSDNPTNTSPTPGSNSPSCWSLMSHHSVKSEQERDQGVLVIQTNPLSTMKRSLCSPNLSTVDPLWTHEHQALLQNLDELVVLQVAAGWETLAIHLGVEPARIDIIKRNNSHSCGNACYELFFSWIKEEKGTGQQPRTWDSIIRAIRKMGLEGLADQLSNK